MRDLQIFLADNTGSWQLQGDGTYVRLTPGDSAPVSAQDTLLDELSQA